VSRKKVTKCRTLSDCPYVGIVEGRKPRYALARTKTPNAMAGGFLRRMMMVDELRRRNGELSCLRILS